MFLAGTWIEEQVSREMFEMSMHGINPQDIDYYRERTERRKVKIEKTELAEPDIEELSNVFVKALKSKDGEKIGIMTTER